MDNLPFLRSLGPIMRSFFAFVFMATGIAVSLSFTASPALAQASRTWVSGFGSDFSPCSRTDPCKTFAGALSKTAVNGEINCLDAGDFGAATITKSITIDCHESPAEILNAGMNGSIIVLFDSFAGTDVRKTVNLRNLTIQGFDGDNSGIYLIGAGNGSRVDIEDCLIDGYSNGFGGAGIIDNRGQGQLNVNNTTVRNVGGAGILVSSSNGSTLRAIITNSRFINSSAGVSLGGNADVFLSHVVIASNSQVGLVVGGSSTANVDSTTIASNTDGIDADGTGVVRLSNSDVSFNRFAVIGRIVSFVDNRFTNNDNLGTITPNNVLAR